MPGAGQRCRCWGLFPSVKHGLLVIEVKDWLIRQILEAVIGVPDERWGEAVKAYVLLKPGMTATESEIIDFCKQLIATYKCPKSVSFVEAMPKSGAGKILKRELRGAHWKGHKRSVA